MTTLYQEVMSVMQTIKRGSLENVMPFLAGKGYDEAQVLRAMRRAAEKTRNDLICEGHRRKTGLKGGALPSIYRISSMAEERITQEQEITPVPKPKASVWELGVPSELMYGWPPLNEGRRHVLMDEVG